jgi:hypothetical protein
VTDKRKGPNRNWCEYNSTLVRRGSLNLRGEQGGRYDSTA